MRRASIAIPQSMPAETSKAIRERLAERFGYLEIEYVEQDCPRAHVLKVEGDKGEFGLVNGQEAHVATLAGLAEELGKIQGPANFEER